MRHTIAQTDDAPKLLYFVPQSILPIKHSGIQRVAREAAEALLGKVDVDFVKWDGVEGQLRYLNAFDCRNFFRDSGWRARYEVHRLAERRRYRFIDTVPAQDQASTWLLMPEVFYHIPDGRLIYRNVIAQVREYGLRTAAVFYDLIPITNALYREQALVPHELYVRQLLDVDLILPISAYSGEVLRRYEAERYGIGEAERARCKRLISAVPLGESASAAEVEIFPRPIAERDVVLLLGTIEPRKQQTRVLRVLRDHASAALQRLRFVVVGSLHSHSAKVFRDLLAALPNAEYHGYLSDDEIAELWQRARFSVFASNDEGFGLPISESLAHGVPCLTAKFGAMQEVAANGGCLLVDVDDDRSVAHGLARLAEDDALIHSLEGEIRDRPRRSWDTYADEVLAQIGEYDALFEHSAFAAAVRAALDAFLAGDARWSVGIIEAGDDARWAIGCAHDLTADEAAAFAEALDAERYHHLALSLPGLGGRFSNWGEALLDKVWRADGWLFEDKGRYDALVGAAKAHNSGALLPSRCIVDPSPAAVDRFAAAVADLQRQIERRRLVAGRAAAVMAASRSGIEIPPPTLAIVISTYNRAAFVAENVRWLLGQIAPLHGRVKLFVVDNCSLDDTDERLAGFASPDLQIIRNSTNVGMLGNLQVCSTLLAADYAWVIGDDDFITPGTIATILRIIDEQREVPFVFVNFGVYARAAFGPGDRADLLIDNPTVLAPAPAKSGIYPVRDIALQHDNLFTAIYPIVFRADILSACFNHTFTGRPFASLVESVPTTKIVLETYGETPAYWLGAVGIVGNAHNSWQKYRVQWHGVLMPLVFALASEAGVARDMLFEWAQTHRSLLADAVQLYPNQDLRDEFGDDDLDVSYRVFRERLLS